MNLKKTITRPANTTAYAAGDVINENAATTPMALVYEFAAKTPYLLQAHLTSSNPTGTPDIDVYLFSDPFPIAADNAAFDPTNAQNATSFLGKISFTASAGIASTGWSAFTASKVISSRPIAPISLSSSVSPSSPNVYAVLVAAGAYTPIASELITLKLDVEP